MRQAVFFILTNRQLQMKCFLLVLCITFSLAAYTQPNSKIKGKTYDAATGGAIEYATIAVTDITSKKIVTGALSDSTGAFVVNDVPAGVYSITIECIGYTKKTIDNVRVNGGIGSVFLDSILLSASNKTLRDVTIFASTPAIENKIDKMVFNAANDLTSQGGLAIDILKKVPQVNVDINGNVELQGNPNIRFLINGKPSSLFGNSITDALSAIPASQIKSIEVITSPGAKYDAQGTGGIINIILKENKIQGINGSINLSAGTRLENGSANISYRHANWGISAFFSGNAQLASRTPATQDRTSFDTATNTTHHLLQDGYSDFRRNGYQSGASLDWNITKHDNINASINFNHFGNSSEGITQVQQDTVPGITRNAYSHFVTNSLDWSINYKKTFKTEGQELNILYNASSGLPITYYQQASSYKNQVVPYTGSSSNNPGTNSENSFSADYTHPFKSKAMFEAGAKTTFQDINSSAKMMVLQPATGSYQADPGQSYQLNYKMLVYAGYLSISFPLSGFLKVKAGTRYEYTDTKIDFPNTNIPAYGTLVPSVTLSHNLNKGQFLKLSYSRRIERADYRDVNPFLNFSDPYNITTGNPLLKPELGNNMELGYNKSFGKGGNIYVALIERINTQDHKPVTTFYPTYSAGDTVFNNVSVQNIQNIGTEYNSGMNVSGSWTIKGKLSLRGNVFFSHRRSIGLPAGSNGSDGNRFRSNLNASYQFTSSYIGEVFGNYNSASNNVQGKSPQSVTYTVAFRKQFLKKKASLGITATNIFNEYTRQVITIETAGYNSYTIRRLPYRSAGISFTYKFGKLEFKKGKEEDTYQNNPPTMGG